MIWWRFGPGRKFPDCRFPLAATATVADAIRNHQQRRQPFCLVRVGDSEGALLAWDRSARPMDLEYLARYFGDHVFDPRFVQRLQSRLRAALQAADWLGIREDMLGVPRDAVSEALPDADFRQRVKAVFPLREVERDISFAGARRLWLTHRFLASHRFPRSQRYCSAWAHFDLFAEGALAPIMRSARRVKLISSHASLPQLLARKFDLEIDYISVPPKPGQNHSEAAHAIARFESILAQRLITEPGQLVLVGAGIWAKLICKAVRDQGGIGLDIGALADAWAGKPTRALVFASRFGTPMGSNEVPPALRLDAPPCSPAGTHVERADQLPG